MARSLQVIGDWWSLLIIRDAFRGKGRFSEFQKSLGLAKNILSSRLKKLVDEGILQIAMEDGTATYNRYILTEKGERLYIILAALWQWGEQNCSQEGELTYAMVDRQNMEPLAKLELMARDGRVLGPRDFHTVARSELPGSKKRLK
ncbi:MAG: helix-turn-helix transcriptional regulator [Blastocatellia bacterium]|nr:helix-turn-helix transcriptional regulator [Blastocatellia bacterium]